jgi:integrative and conjugative element protein (TIGR02256 family)
MSYDAQRYSNGRYVVHLTEPVATTLQVLAVRAGRRETGGILIGHYQNGEAWITEATPPPPDSKGGLWHFERGSEGLKAYLQEKWVAEPREYYLGEWHSHPSRQAHPSTTDHRQMQQILNDPDIDCALPILIVAAGRARPLPVFSIHVYDGTNDYPEALEFAE